MLKTIRKSVNNKSKWLLQNRPMTGTVQKNIEELSRSFNMCESDIIIGRMPVICKSDNAELSQRAGAILDFQELMLSSEMEDRDNCFEIFAFLCNY